MYNGKFYGGSIPRAEVWRYDGDGGWTLLKKFLECEPMNAKEWTRLTSLTVYDGRLFASVGSCTGSILDAPSDVRGKVFCAEMGKCISFDYDLGSGWKHVAAVKEEGRLKLYINGELKVTSPPFEPREYDISNDKPLKIGFGELDYFSGRMCEIRLYNRAMTDDQVGNVFDEVNTS